MEADVFAVAFDIRHSTFGLVRGHSSVGRAPALQAGCQGFESPCLQKPARREASVYNGRAALLGWAGANPLASRPSLGAQRRAEGLPRRSLAEAGIVLKGFPRRSKTTAWQ